MAVESIKTHLHRSFNWGNGASGAREGSGGVRLAVGTAYPLDVFG